MGKMDNKSSIKKKGKSLVLAADALLEVIYECPDTPKFLHEILNDHLTWQQRQEFSVAKSVLAPNLDVRWLSALLALSSEIEIEGGENISLSEYLKSRSSTGKIINLCVPLDSPNTLVAGAKVALTPADKPVVSAVCGITLQKNKIIRANISLSGVWQKEKVKLAKTAAMLIDQLPDTVDIEAVASEVRIEVSPKGDFRGSEEYRRAMAGVVTKRAMESCLLGVIR